MWHPRKFNISIFEMQYKLYTFHFNWKYVQTRMHSSRMCNARSSSHHRGSTSPRAGTPQAGTPQAGILPRAVTPPRADTPLSRPLVWAWKPPQPDSPQLPPWVWAWKPARHAGIPPLPEDLLQGTAKYWDTTCNACTDTTPLPLDRILDTRFWKYYLPQTSFAGGNKDSKK